VVEDAIDEEPHDEGKVDSLSLARQLRPQRVE
jgi:hypothetical protein